jgi:hypothetical protein
MAIQDTSGRRISLQPVIDAIDKLIADLQNLKLSGADAKRREAAVNVLNAVKTILMAFCYPEGTKLVYYWWQF